LTAWVNIIELLL